MVDIEFASIYVSVGYMEPLDETTVPEASFYFRAEIYRQGQESRFLQSGRREISLSQLSGRFAHLVMEDAMQGEKLIEQALRVDPIT